MHRTPFRIATATALVLTSLAQRSSAQTTSQRLPPTLVVQITVDQLRPDYFDRFASQLTGGLGRLMRQGAFFTNATHDHGTTETAPGHATLWSGRFPSHTGIVRNEVGVADPQMPLLFGRGLGASPFRFRGSAFFDWVRTRDPGSRALSVSRKDRGAILPLGRARQSVFWYSLDGRFTTSRYYGDTFPTWVQKFNATNFTAKYLGTDWNLLLPDSAYAEKDSVSHEHQGKDFVFPHKLPADQRTGTFSFTDFPWMDDVTVDFALAGMNALELGKGPTLDVLSVSLSTTDAIGHAYGPNSRELHDQVLRVDRALGRLIDSLFRMRDSTRIVFALGSDHGVTPRPEEYFPGTDPMRGRVNFRAVVDSARSALVRRAVSGDVLDLESGIVVLDREQLTAKGVNADSVVTALRNELLRLPGILRIDRPSTLAAAATKGDVIARRWSHSIPADMEAVLTITMKPYYHTAASRDATHGTPHDLDARIPILFMGPTIKPGRYAMPVRSVDVAPTLGAVTGVKPIEPIDGRILKEALVGGAIQRK